MNKDEFLNLLPENLYHDILNKSCGFFIGAGISCSNPTNLPGWKQLLEGFITTAESNNKFPTQILEELRKGLENNKFLEVAEYLQGNLKEDYIRHLMSVFDNEDLIPNKNHESLSKIDAPIFITTNYDKLLDNSIIRTGKNPIVATPNKSELLEQIHKVTQRKKILKIHGDISDVKSLVLSETDYMEILNNTSIDVIINSYFHRNTFLFVGCSMTDPDILIFLKQLKSIFNGYSPTHYALVRKGEISHIEQYTFKTIYNIEFLFIDNFNEVTSFLEQVKLLQETSNKNKFEIALDEHSTLNYFEYFLDQLEYYIEVEISGHYYDYEHDYANNYKNLDNDLRMYNHIRDIFEDFHSQNLYKITAFPYEEFMNLFNDLKQINDQLKQLPYSDEKVKEHICDYVNETNDSLENFVKIIKGYIRLRRVHINNDISSTDFNRTMMEVYEKNYSK